MRDASEANAHKLDLKDVILEVPNQNMLSSEKYARLINGLDIEFESGKMYAFMGTSGSSKTTTMEAIAGMVPYGSRTSGEILIDNEERDEDSWGKESAYGRQQGYTISELTVEEFINYSIAFSLPHEDKERIKTTISEVLCNVLGLEHVRANRMENLSGGEKKRVSVAVTFSKMLLLEGKLKVVLLDEPTSELDSGLAMDVANFLKGYAKRNGTMVLVTIHQPGHGLFNTFDGLLFMDKGVKIYAGPTSGFMKYLNSKGIYNTSKEETDLEFIFGVFNEKSERGKLYKDKVAEIKRERGIGKNKQGKFKDSVDTAVNFIPNFSVATSLAKRQLIIDWRNLNIPYGFILTVLLTLFLAGVAKCVVMERCNLPGSILACFIFRIFSVFLSSIPNGLLKGIGYTTKEVSYGLYNSPTLWFSALILETPLIVLRFTIFFGIIYWFGLVEGDDVFFLGSRLMLSVLSSNVFRLALLCNADPLSTFGRITQTVVSFLVPLISPVMPFIGNMLFGSSQPSESNGASVQAFCKWFFGSLYSVLIPSTLPEKDIYAYCQTKRPEEGLKMIPSSAQDKSAILDLITYYLEGNGTDASSQSFSNVYALTAVILLSILALSLLGISFLDRRFTPSTRYQLSSGRSISDKNFMSSIKSLTRGIWFKRFLITLVAVLIVLTVALALSKSSFYSGALLL
ncbi:ABCG-like ABC transporter [Encephalitozoon hellem ATCC 50504]|uniref:Sterolin-1 n=1 Tax=Encephalitozoon hellem TaxID=27973 RepID=A0A9Q9CAG8_ENCHE|nr:ABCG-like ABC transporter [Encephalitozoon hellem ATCC 50504]AFM98396.1 ABCG-like ABC transporter [Encephalitozoon hellem ATCC 50504]UTX43318.1 sterolin-1 [Encephalitozoon hellem]|eukprot:XP_003887377.1 ABCG-like ABC transporter [Encephalitozoon hellem ATCC 50504]